MQGGIEVAGDIATGALIGRAVEPHAGEAARGGHAHGLCLNCGTALHGDFCHACGQAGHVHRTLASIGHDLLHGVFHFEGKVWRTLPMLVTRPGTLTRRYIDGERARFVSPLALFLFSVFLMFAVLHLGEDGGETTLLTPAERASKIAQLDRKIAAEDAELAALRALPADRQPPGKITSLSVHGSVDRSLRASLIDGKAEADLPLKDLGKTGWHKLDKGIAKVAANPSLAVYKLQSSAYKYSWALIPISVPLVAILFLWRRRFKLYDHAIFVTYSLSFMMFLIVTMSIALAIEAPGWIFGVLWFAPPVHMFFQLRGTYGLRKRSALWRTVVLQVFAFIALMLFGALLVALGLLG